MVDSSVDSCRGSSRAAIAAGAAAGDRDEKISPFGTVSYYKAVVRHAGGFAASQAFSRLYMIHRRWAYAGMPTAGA
jgi:hypothetical protein